MMRFKAREPHHNLQIVRHVEIEEEADRNQLIDMGVFKQTSGNATKRLRVRQETREATRNGKTAEATLEQIVSQEFQAEKGKMQIWKRMIMEEVAHELQIIKESAEAQKIEMEVVKEQLQEMEAKSTRLEKEIGLFKAKEQKLGQHWSKDMSAMKENQAQLTEGNRKSQENLAETVEQEEVYPAQRPKNKDATLIPSPQMSQTKNTQKTKLCICCCL